MFQFLLKIRIQTTTKPLNERNAKCQAMNTKWVFFTHAHTLLLFEIHEMTKCLCSYGNGQTITKILYTMFTVVKHEYISAAQTKHEEKKFCAKETTRYSHEYVDASFGHIVHMFTQRLQWLYKILYSPLNEAGLACNGKLRAHKLPFRECDCFFLRRERKKKMREWAHYDPHDVLDHGIPIDIVRALYV